MGRRKDVARWLAATMAGTGLLAIACSTPDPHPTEEITADAPTPRPAAEATATVVPAPAAAPQPAYTPRVSADNVQRFTGFVPLDDPEFVSASDATGLTDQSLVLGLEWKGEARAYPLRMIAYHHIVNDTVRGDPLLVTF